MITDWQDIVHREAKDHVSHTRNILQFRRFLWDILLKTRKNMPSFIFAFDRREEMVFKNLFPMLPNANIRRTTYLSGGSH